VGSLLPPQHVVEDAAEAVIYFPAYRDGAAIPELTHYHHQVAAVRGQVVHCDVPRDLALLRLDALPETWWRYPSRRTAPVPAMRSIRWAIPAPPRGRCGRYTAGRVRSVYQGPDPPGERLLKARIVETESYPSIRGQRRPLVNDSGELVGVVLSSSDKRAW